MKKILYIIIFLLLIPSVSFGLWTKKKVARELCFLSLLSTDLKQTIYVANNPRSYIEDNKILKQHPSRRKVCIYFIISAIAHATISYILPENYSKVWQVAWIGIQSNVIEYNNSIGLKQDIDIAYRINYTLTF